MTTKSLEKWDQACEAMDIPVCLERHEFAGLAIGWLGNLGDVRVRRQKGKWTVLFVSDMINFESSEDRLSDTLTNVVCAIDQKVNE